MPRGRSATFRDATNVLYEVKSRTKSWEGNSVDLYVCSRRYGRRVLVGWNGSTPDGPQWSRIDAMNVRYAARVDGYSGNADGSMDTNISVLDLKTGKTIASAPPETAGDDGADLDVETVALSRTGAVAWTYANFVSPSLFRTVNVLRPGHKRGARLATSAAIHGGLLRWRSDGSEVLWTERPSSVPYTPFNEVLLPKPRGTRSCLRPGDRAEGRDSEYIYVSREYRSDGWKHGRSLIACSREFRHRVVLARSGTKAGIKYSYDAPFVSARTAAVVVRQTAGRGSPRNSIRIFDITSARRSCAAAIPSDLATPRVRKVVFGTGWSTAWTVTSPGRLASLFVCDAAGVRRVATTAPIDPNFLAARGGAFEVVEIGNEIAGG